MTLKCSTVKYVYRLISSEDHPTLYLDSAYDVILYLQDSEDSALPVTIGKIKVCCLREVDDESTST